MKLPITTGEWSVPLDVSAVRPDPLSCHCFVKFDAHRAILFGGTYKDGRKNDTWIFDLEERVMIATIIGNVYYSLEVLKDQEGN